MNSELEKLQIDSSPNFKFCNIFAVDVFKIHIIFPLLWVLVAFIFLRTMSDYFETLGTMNCIENG